jgi:hypothetical protein
MWVVGDVRTHWADAFGGRDKKDKGYFIYFPEIYKKIMSYTYRIR